MSIILKAKAHNPFVIKLVSVLMIIFGAGGIICALILMISLNEKLKDDESKYEPMIFTILSLGVGVTNALIVLLLDFIYEN